MKHKNIIQTLEILFLLLLCNGLIASTNCRTTTDNNPILIVPRNTSAEGIPKSPPYNPFYAYLQEDSIVLCSLSDIGVVSVCIESSFNTYYQTIFDTKDSILIIPFLEEGPNIITITTIGGLVFEGHFII